MKKFSLFIFLISFFSFPVKAQKYDEVEKDMLIQLSQGKWQLIYNRINDTIKIQTTNFKKKGGTIADEKTLNLDCNRQSVSRFLYGHAALISGKNNISTKQFYCACDSARSQSLRDWFSFASDFEKEYPKSFVSHYLLGDAYARNGEIKKAKEQLDTALILSPNDVASLNCRAVITWLLYENCNSEDEQLTLKLSAIADIQKGINLNPRFADLYANEAIIDMRNTGEMDNSRKELGEAIQIDSTYYLAQNSLAFSYAEEGNKTKYDDIKMLIDKYDPSNPFTNLKSSAKNKRDTSNRGNMTSLSFGMDFKSSILTPELPSMSLNFGASFDPRGGVYDTMIEGKNLTTITDDKSIVIGTWFNFNYPSKILTVKKVK